MNWTCYILSIHFLVHTYPRTLILLAVPFWCGWVYSPDEVASCHVSLLSKMTQLVLVKECYIFHFKLNSLFGIIVCALHCVLTHKEKVSECYECHIPHWSIHGGCFWQCTKKGILEHLLLLGASWLVVGHTFANHLESVTTWVGALSLRYVVWWGLPQWSGQLSGWWLW